MGEGEGQDYPAYYMRIMEWVLAGLAVFVLILAVVWAATL